MKRLFAILLVVMMIFAVSTTAFAVSSPTQTFILNVDSEGKGHATSSTHEVKVDEGNATFTAVEDGGFFVKWIIEGDFDIVSGDIYSPVIVITPHSDINAIASFSNEKDYLNVYAKVVPDEYGDATAEPSRIAKGSGETSTLTATEKNGGVFQEWVLECDYEIVSGDLKSKVLVIRPETDVYATAYFTKPGEEPTEPKTPDKKDDTSPKTGYPLMLIIGAMGLALIGGVVATKKIKG